LAEGSRAPGLQGKARAPKLQGKARVTGLQGYSTGLQGRLRLDSPLFLNFWGAGKNYSKCDFCLGMLSFPEENVVFLWSSFGNAWCSLVFL
jgi:hypothetical protein